MLFALTETARSFLTVFTIVILGYLLGSIHIKGINLGTAAIFLVGLVFGHFGVQTPAALQTLGILFFVTAVGMSAGPTFIQRMKMNGRQYLVLCLTIAATGGLVCLALMKILHVETPLAVGIMTGSFTTSPGFAAAKEAVSASKTASAQVAAGYGLAYPLGIVCKVLAIQLIPKLLHADMAHERELIALPEQKEQKTEKPRKRLDTWGFLPVALTLVLGILLGAVTINLPGGGHFSLGVTGGPLIAGLLVGHVGHIGRIDLRPDPRVCGPMKEIGMFLFFSGAGVEGGHDLMAILTTYGAVLILYAVLLVVIPVLVGTLMFRKVLKLPLLNGLGSMTASMTCTPSLAVLIEAAGTDDVAAAYATTYPIALITLILLVQVLMAL